MSNRVNGCKDILPEPGKTIGDILHLLLKGIGAVRRCPGDPVEDIARQNHIRAHTELNPGDLSPFPQRIDSFEYRIFGPFMHGWVFRRGLFSFIDGSHDFITIAICQTFTQIPQDIQLFFMLGEI